MCIVVGCIYVFVLESILCLSVYTSLCIALRVYLCLSVFMLVCNLCFYVYSC